MNVPFPLGAQQSPSGATHAATRRGVGGGLEEAVSSSADSIDNLTQIEPVEGSPPADPTVGRVLSAGDAIDFRIRAEDLEASRITSLSRNRDASPVE